MTCGHDLERILNLRQVSIDIIKANQHPSGAYVASPTFSQYGYSWLRDGMWIAHSMDCVGEHASATAFHRWASNTLLRYQSKIERLVEKIDQGEAIEETDYLPTRFTVDSAMAHDDWPNFQLDGYGAWLWGAVQHCQRYNPDLWQEIRPAIAVTMQYLQALWQSPNYDSWEEFREEIHISTLATLYGGLKAVYEYDPSLFATRWFEVIREFILENGVSGDGHFMKFLGNANVDANLMWLALPYGVVDVHDERYQRTLEKIERDIHYPDGGVYRYQADTYFGGGEWLLLTCWLAWVYLELDRVDEARQLLKWVETQASPAGDMPEQVAGHLLDPSYYQGWVDRWGESACPLLWSHAMYLIVLTMLEQKSV